jgi:uncharacterized protein YecT (DUF1311 family)
MPSFSSFHSGGAAGIRASSLLLLAGLAAASLAIQQPAAAPAPTGQPPPAVFQNPIPAAQLAFLGSYNGQPTKTVKKDKQFRALMKLVVPGTEYHYGRDMPLADAADTVLDGSMLPVSILGRYAIVSGYNGPYLRGRGFMWFDMQQGYALGVFYFQPTNGEPTPTLTVFSRQVTDTSLGISQLPLSFAEQLNDWALVAQIPAVTPRYFIPANGKKYVLVHDEDFCDRQANARPPDPGVCQQLNAEAADDDMNAAYFMRETHNAADATAWMLGPDQEAWISFRDSSCGLGLACRIAITRQRTRVLLGPPPPSSHRH